MSVSPAPTPPSLVINPTRFYEYDGTSITQVANPTFCSAGCNFPAYATGMLVLPTGQVLLTSQSNNVQVYTSPAAQDSPE